MWLIYSILGITIFLNIFSLITSRFRDPYEDIFFVMALPGQGKSLFFIEEMLKYKKKNEKLLKKGKKEWAIYSDTPVNIEGVRLFKPLDIAKYWPEENCVMFLDEISLTWDARKFRAFDEGVSEFMKLHRHGKIIIYAASQNFDCDKRIRDLCNHFLITSKHYNCIQLIRPVRVKFPIFTAPDSEKGSDIAKGYEWDTVFKWKLFWMPKYFGYGNTRDLPERPPLPYTVLHANPIKKKNILDILTNMVDTLTKKLIHQLKKVDT